MQNPLKHIKTVGWLHIALNLLSIVFALFAAMYFKTAFLPSAIVIFSIVGLTGGIGLLKFKPWARILTIVMSILNLVAIPLGTAVGIYSLIVLFDQEAPRHLASGASEPAQA